MTALAVPCDGCGRLMAPETAHLPHRADCPGEFCGCPDRWLCLACCSECQPVVRLRWGPLFAGPDLPHPTTETVETK